MATKHNLKPSLNFGEIPGNYTTPIIPDFSNSTNYQLEYLDLSAAGSIDHSYAGISLANQNSNSQRGTLPLQEAEYYSFDDYLPNITVANSNYENVYTCDYENIYVNDDTYTDYSPRLPGSQADCFDIPQDNHINGLSWRLSSDFQSKSHSGSTCSGSSSSNHSVNSSQVYPYSLTSGKYNHQAPTSSTSHRNRSKLYINPPPAAAIHSIYDMHPSVRKSLSTDSFKKLHTYQALPKTSEVHKLGSTNCGSVPLYQSNQENLGNSISNRTEELLNGIVKLAEDTVDLPHIPKIKPSVQQPKTKSQRKPQLHTSKSTPLLSSQSSVPNSKTESVKPPSPVTTSRRFAFIRKGSFHGSADHDRKVDKKNKMTEKNAHLNAYLNAVESSDTEQLGHLLNVDKSCVNSVNSEGLTALDVAVLTNNISMVKTLQKYGASTKFLAELREQNILSMLEKWLSVAERQLTRLKATAGGSNKDEKKISQWEFKHRLFRRMRSGYDETGLPGQPQNVKLSVTSDSSISVGFDTPEENNSAIVSRYKVEWSQAQNFRPLAGEVMINEMHNLHHNITGLECGTPYFVRVTAWNVKGFGRPAYSDPLYAIPSSWRGAENLESRANSFKLHKLNQIITNFKKSRNPGHDPSKDTSPSNGQQCMESPPSNRKSSRRGLRGLFSSSFKFQKSLKRGVYLVSICFNEDKVLVTTEDNLPIIEVDENYNSHSLQSEFDWLMKVLTSSWDTARQVKQDLEKLELSSMQLKNQLLTAVLQMQELIGMQELGHLFYKPIYDGNGSAVIAVVNHMTDPKQMGNITSAVKWQTHNKLMKNSQPSDPLLSMLNEMMFFNQVSRKPLSKGLYLGYLNIKFNTESVRVLAPESNPSVLPYIKIRDCPNISKPEWKSILDLSRGKVKPDSPDVLLFKKQLVKSVKKLANKLELLPQQLGDHRVYDVEVLEFSEAVSFILLMPPRELVCNVKTQANDSAAASGSSSEYMEIPIRAFEMIHLQTYQGEFISEFCKSACLIDSQLVLAQQLQREAFSNEEIDSSRKLVESARTYHHQLEDVWKSTRWLADAISYARGRDGTTPGLKISQLSNSIAEQSSNSKGFGDYVGKNLDEGYHSDKISLGGSTGSDKPLPITNYSAAQMQSNTNNNNGHDSEQECSNKASVIHEQPKPGILRVYAAYESGLTRGTSVMLHVTPKTTSREVIDLVIMQLNKEVIRKGLGGPTYVDSQLQNFCLVAVIGPRERVLRDDYRLLHLQNPWVKGKLFVRTKDNLLAALTQGETADV